MKNTFSIMTYLLKLICLFCNVHYSASQYFDPTPSLPEKKFFALWNAPSAVCKTKWNVSLNLEENGIVVNEDHDWYGDYMSLFYQNLGAWPYYDLTTKHAINGGLPQLANLTAHLAKMADDMKTVLPDEKYRGMAVIDFEHWKPIYDQLWDFMGIYRLKSEELVKAQNPSMSYPEIQLEAKRQFESAAKEFMLKTLELGRQLRPNALWGYYGFPRCNNDKTQSSDCHDIFKQHNDQLMWMFNASTVVLPSIYLYPGHRTHPFDYAKGNIVEALRVSSKAKNGPLPVFAYVMLLYPTTENYLDKNDMYATITQSAELGASGVIIWGGSAHQTQKLCSKLKPYIADFLGPLVKTLSSVADQCSSQYCSSNGRCQFKLSRERQLNFAKRDIIEMRKQWSFVKCNCDRGWEGKDCSSSFYGVDFL